MTDRLLPLKMNSSSILIGLLIGFAALYLLLSFSPKHTDYWSIYYMAKYFALYGFGFINHKAIVYPSTTLVVEGLWIKACSMAFNFDLNSWVSVQAGTRPGFLTFWGMIPYLVCLYSFVALSFYTLKNKWLSLICFGVFTFISITIMGQEDIYCALLIFISLALFLMALERKNNIYLLLLSVAVLGLSMQTKPFGGLLLPVYLIFMFQLFKGHGYQDLKCYGLIVGSGFVFLFASFFLWLPQMQYFLPYMVNGESSWLFNLQIAPVDLPPFHTISIWLLGYAIILFDALRNALKADKHVDRRYFIFYTFAVFAWLFATVFTHPQWWLILVPFILLVLDNFHGRLNYLLCLSLATLFIFYPMMWTNNIDKYLVHYIPIVPIFGVSATILATAVVALLLIWIMEIKGELLSSAPDYVPNGPRDAPGTDALRSHLDEIAPLLIVIVPFIVVFIIVPPIVLSVGAAGVKNNAYDMASGPIYGNVTVGQTFISPRDDLNGIYIRFNNTLKASDDIIFHLRSNLSSPDIVTIPINPESLSDIQFSRIDIPDIAGSNGKQYYFFLESPGSSPDKAVSVMYEADELYAGGTAYVNGTPIEGDLSFRTVHKSNLSDVMTIYY